MEQRMIKFIVYAITMTIIYIVIARLNNRGIPTETDRDHYVVRMPAVLKYVCLVMFLLGLLLFIIFLFFKMKGNPSITAGNLWFALIFAGIGLLVMIFSSRWKITIEEGQMSIYRLFHKTQVVSINDLDEARTGSKGQITLSYQGKNLVTVDALCDNYLLLEEDLKEAGKLQ